MTLTPEQKSRANSYSGKLDKDEQKALLAHIEATPAKKHQKLIDVVIKNGGEKAEFVRHLIAKPEADGKKDAPHNKASQPIHTK